MVILAAIGAAVAASLLAWPSLGAAQARDVCVGHPVRPERRLHPQPGAYRRRVRPRHRRAPRLRARRHQGVVSGLPLALLRRQRQQAGLHEPRIWESARRERRGLRPARGLQQEEGDRRAAAGPSAAHARAAAPSASAARARPGAGPRARGAATAPDQRRPRMHPARQADDGVARRPQAAGPRKPRVRRVVFFYRKTHGQRVVARSGPSRALPALAPDPPRAGPPQGPCPGLLPAPGHSKLSRKTVTRRFTVCA